MQSHDQLSTHIIPSCQPHGPFATCGSGSIHVAAAQVDDVGAQLSHELKVPHARICAARTRPDACTCGLPGGLHARLTSHMGAWNAHTSPGMALRPQQLHLEVCMAMLGPALHQLQWQDCVSHPSMLSQTV